MTIHPYMTICLRIPMEPIMEPIVKMRKEGTMTYYYLDPDMESFNHLINTLQQSIDICRMLPDRSGEN